MKANSKSAADGKESIVVKEEKDKFGNGTGHYYYECACGAQLMTRYSKGRLEHKAGCPEAER